jgi:hypothetical protein
MQENGNRTFPWYTDNSSTSSIADTSHTGDIIYAVLRGKQLGYDFAGLIDEFIAAYESHLNYNWFKTSAGFNGYANGSGQVNQHHLASSSGHSLGAAISSELKERWVDMVLNHEPTFSFYSSTGNNPYRAMWMAGGLLWAIGEGTL